MSGNREWQAVEYNLVSKMAASGKTDAEIGAMLLRTSDEIYKARKVLGINSSNLGEAWTPEGIAVLTSMFNNGCRDKEIALALGRSVESIHRKRHRVGLISQPKPRVPGGKSVRTLPAHNLSVMTAEDKRAYLRSLPPLQSREVNTKRIEHCHSAFLLAMFEAGHKPGQGEFVITSEARVVRPSHLVGA